MSDERLGEPATNRALFELLVLHGWLSDELSSTLGQMVGFRNILVHGYDVVDVQIVREILEHPLDDLLRFVEEIRQRLSGAT